MIRIGAKEDKIVDNADAGGAFVAIDIEKGILTKDKMSEIYDLIKN